MFFIHIFFSTSSLTLPWTMVGFLHPFYNFGLAHCRVIRETFIFNHSVIFLPRALRALSGHFLPTGIFYLTLLQRHFNLYLSKFLRGQAGLPSGLQGFILSSNHRPGPSACLIHNNAQSTYSERLSFKFYHILWWIACGESLIYLLLTCLEPFSLVQSICKNY